MSDAAKFVYKCTDYYHPQSEVSLLWNDPQLSIAWPIPAGSTPQLSVKDSKGFLFADAPKFS